MNQGRRSIATTDFTRSVSLPDWVSVRQRKAINKILVERGVREAPPMDITAALEGDLARVAGEVRYFVTSTVPGPCEVLTVVLTVTVVQWQRHRRQGQREGACQCHERST